MSNQMLQPQEVEVFYIIPAIRSYIARFMKKQGRSQKEIARLLGVRESTVSQYMTEKRATLHFNEEIKERIKEVSGRITNNLEAITAIQILLKEIERSKAICEIHMKLSKDVPEGCSACFGSKIKV
ncbi:MAG TPA: helix-turn-helix domain-containing protein [Candidatus Nanoarchaeia archaeon]|nr:helix-turn-helix domain-containing protein [Candidatus Nanoarchaeia archaeon]